jgi:SagB-type dehydrogenase family enzyme
MFRVFLGVLLAMFLLLTCSSLGRVVSEPQKAGDVGDTLTLPDAETTGSISVEEALLYRRSIKLYKDRDLTLSQVSQLLWACQGITEQKRKGRTAPSAGASYPLELYVLWQNSLWHYIPESHSLKLRVMDLEKDDVAAVAHGQRPIKVAPACFFISAVYERTEHHYGERALRYVPMEAGHACQNLLLQAVALDLGGVCIGSFSDIELKELLGLAEDETPLYIVPMGYPHPPRKRKEG